MDLIQVFGYKAHMSIRSRMLSLIEGKDRGKSRRTRAWKHLKGSTFTTDELPLERHVYRVAAHAKNIPTTRVPIAALNQAIIHPSELSGVTGETPEQFQARSKRAKQYPVLVHRSSAGLRVIDGYHRVAKAHQAGKTEISAKVMDEIPSKSIVRFRTHKGKSKPSPKFRAPRLK